ncbi:MAG TPA: MarR family winged helix-turn-helix transcriptional regulator [Pseudonocardiaceae bacterium]
MSRASLTRTASLGYQVNYLARLLAHALRERIESLGVVPGQFAQLLALYEQDGLTQAELCAQVEIEQPTMAKTLSRMQRDGLIDRVPDPADGRRSLVMLTPRARELEHELVSAAHAVNAAAIQGLDEQAVVMFMATLTTIIDNIEKAGRRTGKKSNRMRTPAER